MVHSCGMWSDKEINKIDCLKITLIKFCLAIPFIIFGLSFDKKIENRIEIYISNLLNSSINNYLHYEIKVLLFIICLSFLILLIKIFNDD
jgi:hypothetical protein